MGTSIIRRALHCDRKIIFSLLAIAMFVTIAAYYFVYGAQEAGYGSDGPAYADMVLNSRNWIAQKKLEWRYVHRVSLAGTIYLIMTFCHLPFTTAGVISALPIRRGAPLGRRRRP